MPPAYLVTDDLHTSAQALEAYIEWMREWVKAARAGGDLDGLVPVYTQSGGARLAPDPETVRMLASRLDFLEERALARVRRTEAALAAARAPTLSDHVIP